MTCETTGDGPIDAVVPLGDVGTDGDSSLAHLHTAPGWSVAVLVDFSGVVPYNADDFDDPTPVDNQARAVSALYPPYSGSLAVAAGRAIIELDDAGQATVHDYRPAMPDTTGPDAINHVSFLAGTLYVAAASQKTGDGLYTLDAMWGIDRQLTVNNVTGVDLDASGAFDGVGASTLYYVDQNGIEREPFPAGTAELVVAGSSNFFGVVVSPDFIYAIHNDTDLVRVTPMMHAITVLDSGTADMETTDHGTFAGGILAIRDNAQLIAYGADAPTTGVFSDDPAWFWTGSTIVAPPHPLAGKIVVVESNRTLNVDRLLVVTPP